jgi:hypothetical protein
MQRAILAIAAVVSLLAATNTPASAQRYPHHQVHRPQVNDAVTCDNNGRCIAQARAPARYFVAYRHRRTTGARVVRRRSRLAHLDANANGIVRSHKTGATAHVSPRYASRFQAYVNDLEAHGAAIKFMGGYRKGRCWAGGQHPCGKALDVCQLGRGRVDHSCDLPSRAQIASIAASHGLFEGGQWCRSDYGHAQIGITAGACGSPLSARSHRRRIARW